MARVTDLPDAPWITNYDRYRNQYYQVEEVDVSELWAYRPEVCDGDFCPCNCDCCGKADWDDEEEDE